ncbi:MAG: OpgC domain-containing protein [Candidatus Didemnitutus sp.]|nr:OpgC domain-containing protein [Candidatus Didemnitutus sp.]
MPVTPGHVRDRRFDSLRGLLVVLMATNHIASDLRGATDQALGFVSSAEGFVFMSGLVAGWVYARRLLERGFAAACAASARRAGTVYRTHLLTYFVALVWTLLYTLYTHAVSPHLPPWFVTEPLNSVWLGLTLLYQPGLLGILPMYCVLLLALPWVLRASLRGSGFVVLALSFLIWAVTQSASGGIWAWGGRIDLGALHPLAWQFLFVAGAVLGAHKAMGVRLLEPRAWPLALAFAAAVALWLVRHGIVPAPLPVDQLAVLTNKTTLGALRLADFALVAYLVASAATVFPGAFTWRPLALVGEFALPAFAAQCLVALALTTYPELFATTALGRAIGTAAMLGAVFGVAAFQHWQRTRRIEAAIARLLRAPAPKPPPRNMAHVAPR